MKMKIAREDKIYSINDKFIASFKKKSDFLLACRDFDIPKDILEDVWNQTHVVETTEPSEQSEKPAESKTDTPEGKATKKAKKVNKAN